MTSQSQSFRRAVAENELPARCLLATLLAELRLLACMAATTGAFLAASAVGRGGVADAPRLLAVGATLPIHLLATSPLLPVATPPLLLALVLQSCALRRTERATTWSLLCAPVLLFLAAASASAGIAALADASFPTTLPLMVVLHAVVLVTSRVRREPDVAPSRVGPRPLASAKPNHRPRGSP